MQRNTELVTWSSTFSVGVKLIDEQHKGLVELINELFNHVTGDENEERAYFDKVIEQAVRYIRVHFATEEKIMLATKFPGYGEHKKEHQNFVLKVAENIKEYQQGKKLSLAAFTKFLKEWALSHIAIMDKKYFEYFRKIATRNAAGKLSIRSENIR
jgi:hemerythrin